MTASPVETAASHNPQLTTFAHVIRASGLAGQVNSARALTVFAPDNNAFADFGTGNVKTLLASETDLTHLVRYDIVAGRITPARLATGKRLTSLLGSPLHPAATRTGGYRVDNALVICGNVQTANATVYIVNKLLIP